MQTSSAKMQKESNMVRTYGLTHINLAVRDAQRSLRFYGQVFGVEEYGRSGGLVHAKTPGCQDVITFDEHGGCHDHVCPPGQYGDYAVQPAGIAAPPDLDGYTKWDGFDFDRLGVRVPMVMVSPYIKKNTIINTPMSHTSFLRTMREKWGLKSLSTREDASPCFHDSGLLWPTLQRKDMSEMPVLAAPLVPPDNTDYSKAVMAALAKAIMKLIQDLWHKAFSEYGSARKMETHEDAAAFLRDAIPKAKLIESMLCRSFSMKSGGIRGLWTPVTWLLAKTSLLKARHRYPNKTKTTATTIGQR